MASVLWGGAYPFGLNAVAVHFDPPVLIHGEDEVQRLTCIRGAHRVEIGRRETVVEFRSDRPLVIPRLRLSPKAPATLEIKVPRTTIAVQEPLRIYAAQLAGGRSVGRLG